MRGKRKGKRPRKRKISRPIIADGFLEALNEQRRKERSRVEAAQPSSAPAVVQHSLTFTFKNKKKQIKENKASSMEESCKYSLSGSMNRLVAKANLINNVHETIRNKNLLTIARLRCIVRGMKPKQPNNIFGFHDCVASSSHKLHIFPLEHNSKGSFIVWRQDFGAHFRIIIPGRKMLMYFALRKCPVLIDGYQHADGEFVFHYVTSTQSYISETFLIRETSLVDSLEISRHSSHEVPILFKSKSLSPFEQIYASRKDKSKFCIRAKELLMLDPQQTRFKRNSDFLSQEYINSSLVAGLRNGSLQRLDDRSAQSVTLFKPLKPSPLFWIRHLYTQPVSQYVLTGSLSSFNLLDLRYPRKPLYCAQQYDVSSSHKFCEAGVNEKENVFLSFSRDLRLCFYHLSSGCLLEEIPLDIGDVWTKIIATDFKSILIQNANCVVANFVSQSRF
eukprot:snap_masked-scaffold_7-processed-gene-19.18-mRNA-1 protein AED:1.00 eAED:1.00 QI:0/0/0/0/1/1/3/0/446